MINHDSLAVLKKSEMFNVNSNVIFRCFLVLYKSYQYIFEKNTPSQILFKDFA